MEHFEYDLNKSRINKERHGIDFVETQKLWESTHVVIPAKNVLGENRSAIVGKIRERIYAAIFTEKGEIVRLISCHRADGRWQRIYEKYVKEEND